MELHISGVSEQEVKDAIFKNTRGYHLFFEEVEDADHFFPNPFWGQEWDKTAKSLKEIILSTATYKGQLKQFILVFKYDGQDKYAFCSWTKQLYCFANKEYVNYEGKELARKITETINSLDHDIQG